MKEPKQIIGAGMAGCIAAYMNPSAIIIEAEKEPPDNHRAVLRFRSSVVSDVTNIPFQQVRVTKGIWYKGTEYALSPRIESLYSQKVSTGAILSRSIRSLEPVTRYVAPPDFHMQMLERLDDRIDYGQTWLPGLMGGPTISTVPMNIAAEIMPDASLGPRPEFWRAPGYSHVYRVDDCNTHCTIYYPGPEIGPYRATLTGNRLIVESIQEIDKAEVADLVLPSFAISPERVQLQESKRTQYGKIVPIDDDWRKAFIMSLTRKHNVYSLGRFGTWRNILLDDVVNDIRVIRNLLERDMYSLLTRN